MIEDKKIVVITEETIDRGQASIAMPTLLHTCTHMSSRVIILEKREMEGRKEMCFDNNFHVPSCFNKQFDA